MSSTKTTKVTAYGQFYDAVSKEVRSENPTVKDIRKIVSEMWKNADNHTKEEYKQIAAKAKEDAAPGVSGEPGVSETPAAKPKLKKKSDKPLSAFMQYTNEVRNKVREGNPDMKMPEISKVIGQMWKDLGEEGKKPYFDRYKAEAEAKAKAAEAKIPSDVEAETQPEPTPKAVTTKTKPAKSDAPKAATEAITEAAEVVPEGVAGETEAAKAAPKAGTTKSKPAKSEAPKVATEAAAEAIAEAAEGVAEETKAAQAAPKTAPKTKSSKAKSDPTP